MGVDDLGSTSGSKAQDARAKGSASGVRTLSIRNGSLPAVLGSVIKSGKRD